MYKKYTLVKKNVVKADAPSISTKYFNSISTLKPNKLINNNFEKIRVSLLFTCFCLKNMIKIKAIYSKRSFLNENGCYWSASFRDDRSSYYVLFNDGMFYANYYGTGFFNNYQEYITVGRCLGLSVRLVCAAE